MKISKSIVVLAIAGSLLVSCKKETTTGVAETKVLKTIAADAKLATTSFKIDGMTCAIGCAKIIEKELSETSGVKSAKVDFDKKSAKIEYDTNAQSPEKLVEIVEKTGDGATYKVSNVVNSADKAMLYQQEVPKKEKVKKQEKAAAATATTKETATVQAEKPAGKSCCSGKKHCSSDEKKSTM